MSIGSWLLASNAVFFVFSTLAIVASITVFLLTRANDHEKDRNLAAFQAKSAAEIAHSRADIEKAKAEAAQANERAARLELRLQSLRKSRVLSPQVIEQLERAATSFRSSLGFHISSISEPRAEQLADQLFQTLGSAGVPIETHPTMGVYIEDREYTSGFVIEYDPTIDQTDVEALRTLLRVANLSFDEHPNPGRAQGVCLGIVTPPEETT